MPLPHVRSVVACATLVCLGASVQAHAATLQKIAGLPGPHACDSIPGPRDTIEYQVTAKLEVPTESVYDSHGKVHHDTVTTAFRTLVLEAIRQNFVSPANLPLQVFLVRRDVYPAVAAPVVFGEARFSLTETGEVAALELAQSSLSPALDQSLMGAVRRAGSAHSFPLPGEAGVAKMSWLYVSLSSYGLLPGSAPLFAIRVPVWHDPTDPTIDPTHPAKPLVYPPDMLRRGFEGTIYTEFVIDELGNLVPSTLRLSYSNFKRPENIMHLDASSEARLSDFALAILQSMRGAHYTPGAIGGCPVKEIAMQPFTFKIRR